MNLPRSESSPISLFSILSSSPSNLPFEMINSFSTKSRGRFFDSFHDGDPPVPPRKHSRQKLHPRRIGQRHGPRAPDSQEHLLGAGRRHRPRAPNHSTCHGWELAGGGGDSIASCSFGSTFLETIFLAEGYPSFCLPFFGSFSVDCEVHCPSFASFA